jgi:iron(III) transport system substrate-binding protein
MPTLKRSALLAAVVALCATILTGCSASDEQATDVTELTIYSGRSEEFIAPSLPNGRAQSGIKLNIRYGDSAELAAQILEEGGNSPADLFLSQDAGSLGAVAEAGLFTQLSAQIASVNSCDLMLPQIATGLVLQVALASLPTRQIASRYCHKQLQI